MPRSSDKLHPPVTMKQEEQEDKSRDAKEDKKGEGQEANGDEPKLSNEHQESEPFAALAALSRCSKFEEWIGEWCKSEACRQDMKDQLFTGNFDFEGAHQDCKENSIGDSCTACDDYKHDMEQWRMNYCVASCSKANGCTWGDNFPDECHIGVDCPDCRRGWLQVGFGVSTCQGFKAYANAEFVAQRELWKSSSSDWFTLDNIWIETVDAAVEAFGDNNALLTETAKAAAGAFSNMIQGFLMQLLQSTEALLITADTKYQAVVGGSLAVGGAARYDERTARNSCDGEYYCIGKEETAAISGFGGKSMKFFACIRTDLKALRLEGGYDAGTLTLDLEPQPIPSPSWNEDQFVTKVVRKSCWPSFSWKSTTQKLDDGWCGFINAWWHADRATAKEKCTGPCVWTAERPKGCFGSWRAKKTWPKEWENSDGLCPYANSESKCDEHPMCYWGSQPCVEFKQYHFNSNGVSIGCKTQQQFLHGVLRRGSPFTGKDCMGKYSLWCEDCHKHRRHCLSADCRNTMDFCGYSDWSQCRMEVASLCGNNAMVPNALR